MSTKLGVPVIRNLRVLRAFVVNVFLANFAPFAFFTVEHPIPTFLFPLRTNSADSSPAGENVPLSI